MSQPLLLVRWWYGIGIAMIALVIAGSLTNITQPMPIKNADKLHHLLAYGLLMYWWGMVMPRRRWLWALGLVLLGISLEFAQSLSPYRTLDYRDMAFNTAGVTLAGLLLTGPAGDLLARLDQSLGDRFNSGSS